MFEGDVFPALICRDLSCRGRLTRMLAKQGFSVPAGSLRKRCEAIVVSWGQFHTCGERKLLAVQSLPSCPVVKGGLRAVKWKNPLVMIKQPSTAPPVNWADAHVHYAIGEHGIGSSPAEDCPPQCCVRKIISWGKLAVSLSISVSIPPISPCGSAIIPMAGLQNPIKQDPSTRLCMIRLWAEL